jgi:DNA-directed RNA polymerase subunit RPC12/RpoP
MNTTKIDRPVIYLCEECGESSVDANESPLYECQNCGTKFNRDNSADGGSHKCPDCNKFASKLDAVSCSLCDSGPVEEVPAIICRYCEDPIGEDDHEDHIKSNHAEEVVDEFYHIILEADRIA